MQNSAHASPVFVTPDGKARRLATDAASVDGKQRESFIQNLVFDHADVIPMDEIEPAFTPLISLCKELTTPAGSVDNLWMTPDGAIVIGECKLFRNPEARREVVAQALDYANAIARWSYEDLDAAVRQRTKSDTSLYARVTQATPEAERLPMQAFHDAVERRLKAAQFLVLIIGDGIHERAESLTSFLQMHAGLRITLALVDLSVWVLPEGGRLVVPRIPMRTTLIERGVVKIEDGVATVKPPPEPDPRPGRRAYGTTLSEISFYEKVRVDAARKHELREFVAGLSDFGVAPRMERLSMNLERDGFFIGRIETGGGLWVEPILKALGGPAPVSTAAKTYLDALYRIAGKKDGTLSVPVRDLLERPAEWRAAIEGFLSSGDHGTSW